MKKSKTRTRFTILSVICSILFTIATFIVSVKAGQNIPDMLIICFFAYMLVLAIISGVISVQKIKNIEIADLLKAEFKGDDNE